MFYCLHHTVLSNYRNTLSVLPDLYNYILNPLLIYCPHHIISNNNQNTFPVLTFYILPTIFVILNYWIPFVPFSPNPISDLWISSHVQLASFNSSLSSLHVFPDLPILPVSCRIPYSPSLVMYLSPFLKMCLIHSLNLDLYGFSLRSSP